MTVGYPGVLPVDCDDEGDPGDPRVTPQAVSKIGDTSTRLTAFVTAATESEARAIGLAGIGRWASQIGLDADKAGAVLLFPRDNT